MNRERLKKLNRKIVDKYDTSRFENAVHCVMPGHFGGDDVLFIAQNPGQLNTSEDDAYFDAYCDRDYDALDNLYIRALKSSRGTYGTFINDVYGTDWSRISFTNVFKCPFHDNVIPDEIPDSEIRILRRQIEVLQPKLIVLVGSVARRFMIGESVDIQQKSLHTHHPSYLKRKSIREYTLAVDICAKKINRLLRQHGLKKPVS